MQHMTTYGDTQEELCQWERTDVDHNHHTKETKAKHEEIGGGRTHRGGRRNPTDAMDKVLPGSTSIWNHQKYIVSGQHERNVIGKEQEEI